jgi:hypothetical protein
LLIFPLAHHHLLYLGFWNYTLGVAGVLVLAGWVGGTWGGGARMGWGVALLGLGLYFCHPLAWGLGAVAASWVWWRRGSPQGWVWWALVWSPSALLAAWFVWASRGQGSPEWRPVGEVLGQALRMDVAEPFRFQVPILALGAGWAAAASLVSLTGVLRDHQVGAAAVRDLLERVGEDEVMEVRMDPAWRTAGRWRTAVWEHAAGRVVQGGRRAAWVNAYQMGAHGFPVRRLEGVRAEPDVVLVWGAAQAPQGWRLVAETKEPRAGLWRRGVEKLTPR